MTETSVSDKAIEKASGKTWQHWLGVFKEMGADKLAHKDIASKLYEEHGISGWWAQSLTVRYEQAIGRRAPNQESNGTFTSSASKTLDMDMDQTRQWWIDLVEKQKEFRDVPLKSSDISQTPKWRYWRGTLADETKLIITIYEKSAGKSNLGLAHEKLASKEEADEWKAYWKELLSEKE